MDADQSTLKKASKIALLALIALLAGALIFVKERLFADASYIVFNIINYKRVAIQEFRYGSFITQMIPLIGYKLHLSLKVILIGYVVSFNLFYLVVISLLIYRCRQFGLGILMALYYFLFISDSYFWPVNEIHQAVAWMFLFFGSTFYLGKKQAHVGWLLPAFIILAFLTVFTHIVVIIPLFFLWIFFWLGKDNWPFSKQRSILLSTLLVAIVAVKFLFVGKQSYDSEHLNGVLKISLKDIIDSFNAPVVTTFLYRCITNYWITVLVFVTGLISLIKMKKTKLLVWTFVSCIGYISIIGITYSNFDSNLALFHIESEWACLAILVAAPFVFTFLPGIKPTTAILALTTVFIIRVAYICTGIPAFSERTNFQEHILAKMREKGITQLAIYKDEKVMPKLALDWSFTYESLMLSGMNGDDPKRTFCFVGRDDTKTINELSSVGSFYNVWNTLSYKDLNRAYFNIDTTSPYKIMSYEELFR